MLSKFCAPYFCNRYNLYYAIEQLFDKIERAGLKDAKAAPNKKNSFLLN